MTLTFCVVLTMYCPLVAVSRLSRWFSGSESRVKMTSHQWSGVYYLFQNQSNHCCYILTDQ